MSIATIHNLSMNTRRGTIAGDGTVSNNTLETFTFTARPSTGYTVTWGQGSPTTNAITTNGSGTVTQTHTYTTTGAKTVTLTETSTGNLWSTQTITVV